MDMGSTPGAPRVLGFQLAGRLPSLPRPSRRHVCGKGIDRLEGVE